MSAAGPIEDGAAGGPARLVCAGCGWQAPAAHALPFACAHAGAGEAEHVLVHEAAHGARVDRSDAGEHPFVRHREMLWAWQAARTRGEADGAFVERVLKLDEAIAAVDGHGFRPTPCTPATALGAQLGVELWIKDETGQVGGSHKARHLMGILLHLQGLPAGHPSARASLAIASCGNAALGAAVLARAARRRLQVFVPPDAEPAVLQRLHALEAEVVSCPREPGEQGDPCLRRFLQAVSGGALPFCCQGTHNALTIDGGTTLVHEMVDAGVPPLDHLVVQVGGGALASACLQALAREQTGGHLVRLPQVHTVQTHGAWPLRRAWLRLQAHAAAHGMPAALRHAAAHRARYMWPWEEPPHSVASGILDDETYDWLAVLRGMAATGGGAVLADEATLRRAQALAHDVAGIDASATGAAGLAGLLQLLRDGRVRPGERVGVLLSGVRR